MNNNGGKTEYYDTKEKAEAMNVLLDNKYKLEEI